jgi:hypothetical protein
MCLIITVSLKCEHNYTHMFLMLRAARSGAPCAPKKGAHLVHREKVELHRLLEILDLKCSVRTRGGFRWLEYRVQHDRHKEYKTLRGMMYTLR